jgi:outer membrane protein OmpA-like peptidoglycan-associated protein
LAQTWWLPLVALGISVLCYLVHRPHIEGDLVTRTQLTMRDSGLPDVRVAADDQTVTLGGRVATRVEKERAAERARSVWGVTEVVNQIEVQELVPMATKATTLETPPSNAIQSSIEQLLSNQMIQFRVGSPIVLPESFPILDQVVLALRTAPAEAKFEIQGHTDDIGDPNGNLWLSQRRAEEVMNYLIARGVSSAQVVARGYGGKVPLLPNDRPENRQKNRRVAIVAINSSLGTEVR